MVQADAFILIGGRSSRLGTHKAFVEFDGETLVQRAVDVVRNALPESPVTAVAGSSTQFAIEAITADVPFIFDLYEGRGPLGGIHAALSYAKSQWIFVLACDYPFVSSELVGMLAGACDDAFGVVVPEQNDGRMQPLCAFYRVEKARPIVEEILERPRVAPPTHEVVAMLDPLIIPFEKYAHLDGAEELFININTIEDLESARRNV